MLGTPAHVLRFWESRFPQIRPVKRAGGRRYYRPADVMLLTGIKSLLHDQGMTIRGVQKILREQGIRHVAAIAGGDLPDMRAEDSVADLEQALADSFGFEIEEASIEVEPESATIIALETALRQSPRAFNPPKEAAPFAAPQAEVELPDALASEPDQTFDLPPEITDLFNLSDESDGSDLVDKDESSIGLTMNEAEEILVEIPQPFAEPMVTVTAVHPHPLELARRLRQLNARQLAQQGTDLARVHAGLSALHAAISAVEATPFQPLP